MSLETDVDEKVSWWVLPLEREYEDPFEEPEARTGAGEGDTLSHGDAAERGVLPPSQGDTKRASGDAAASIGDCIGCLWEPGRSSRYSRRGVSSHSHRPLSQSDLAGVLELLKLCS